MLCSNRLSASGFFGSMQVIHVGTIPYECGREDFTGVGQAFTFSSMHKRDLGPPTIEDVAGDGAYQPPRCRAC